LDDLQIPSLELQALDKTRVVADAHIRGLPDMDKLDIDLNLQELVTGKADLDRLVAASLLPDSINFPADIRLDGTFNGGLNGFLTDMRLQTSMGSASLAANYQVNNRDTIYDAQVSISNIDIGQLLKMDSVL